jgi:hypothetical protein
MAIQTLTWEWVVQLDLLDKDLQWATHQWVAAVLPWEILRWEESDQVDLLRAYPLVE